MAKHVLTLEPDYDFVLIGISSHVKDYRICWALNEKLGLKLVKQNSLEIKDKKQITSSFFSFFTYDDQDNFTEYSVVSNLGESKISASATAGLFSTEGVEEQSTQNDCLIPEYKHINYFLIIKGEQEEDVIADVVSRIKEIDLVLTAVNINVATLKSKHNLIF